MSKARFYSALGKYDAKIPLGEELQREGIETMLRIVNQISANFLIWITHPQSAFSKALENNTFIKETVQRLLDELNKKFGIKHIEEPKKSMLPTK